MKQIMIINSLRHNIKFSSKKHKFDVRSWRNFVLFIYFFSFFTMKIQSEQLDMDARVSRIQLMRDITT